MLYEITTDCRIDNKDYMKWDVVSSDEIKEFFPSVMRKTDWVPSKSPRVEKEVVEESVPESEELPNEEEVEEKKPAKTSKKSWKKK